MVELGLGEVDNLEVKIRWNEIMSSTTSSSATEACTTGSCVGRKELTEDAINQEFQKLSQGVWKLSVDKKKISIGFTTRSWKKAIAFINELSTLAESEEISHHPGTKSSIQQNTIQRKRCKHLWFSIPGDKPAFDDIIEHVVLHVR